MATKVTSSLIDTVSAAQIQATGATSGQVLTFNASTNTFVASGGGFTSTTPVSTTQLRTTGATNGQVLTYNGTNWAAAAATGGLGASSLASPGYVTLSNGLILQWGSGSSNSSGILAVAFPIAFPNAIYTTLSNNTTDNCFTSNYDITLAGMNISGYNSFSGGNNGAGNTFYWFAIGR